jgi:glycosyltransferase involved in cell wall biosynthesis
MTGSALSTPYRAVILMPVYEDWECAALVCQALAEELRALKQVTARILLVDDGSPGGTDKWPRPVGHDALKVETLRLHTNLGHQRAICIGICYIYEHFPCDAVIVMDADGEDRPQDVVRLIDRAMSIPTTAILAERRKRFEGILFRMGYMVFRVVHRVLTGVSVRIGNFSLLPRTFMTTLIYMPELWNHYAGAVVKSREPCEFIPIDRGVRLAGRSKMNLTSLVTHGISGIATFAETVATRILIANFFALVLLCIVIAVVVGLRIWTNLAIPGWATYTAGLVLILVVQLIGISFSLIFSLIHNRTRMQVTPIRDYAVFVDRLKNMAAEL